MKKYSVIIWAAISCAVALSSCSSLITRWPESSDEKISRDLSVERKDSVFSGFLWTTPDLRAREVSGSFTFNGSEYRMTDKAGTLTVTSDSVTKDFELVTSNAVYRDLSALAPQTVTRHRWVPRTKVVHETIPVTKTRMVPHTSFDAKGNAHTTMQTEFYTDWETRMVTKTEWEWESYQERFYLIPESKYYDVSFPNGDRFYIYRVERNGAVSYYLQNPTYYLARETNESLFGEKDVAVMFVDANADGSFLDDEDAVLFNVWNPYDKGSHYRSLSQVMDNQWYSIAEMKSDYFLSFFISGDSLRIVYENEGFVENKNRGSFVIDYSIEDDIECFLNGKKYSCKSGKPRPIEYGKYRLVVKNPSKLDYEEVFLVDADHPLHTVTYVAPTEAATVTLEHIYAKRYRVSVKSDGYNKSFENQKVFCVPLGKSIITVFVDGFQLVKELDLITTEKIVIDFESEISKK